MKKNKKIYMIIGIVLVLLAVGTGSIFLAKWKKPKVAPTTAPVTETAAEKAEKLFKTLEAANFYYAASYEKATYLTDPAYETKANILAIYEKKIKSNLYLSKTKAGTIYIFNRNLEKNTKVVPSLDIAKNGVFFNFNINYYSTKALNIFGVNIIQGTQNGFYPLSTTFKQNFYMAGAKLDTTLLTYTKRDLTLLTDTFLKTLLAGALPTVNLKVELLSDSKNYTFEIDQKTNQIIQEMAWLVKNYDILKTFLLKLPPK
jgi:hypothetical protein